MKKNGFTLIEIIAVVTILAVILLVTLPSLTGTLKKSNEKAYNSFLDDLYIASENYVVVNSDLFPQLSEINGAAFIKVSDLINAGYIKDDLKNPKTEAPVNVNSTIRVKRNQDLTYNYKYSDVDITTNAYSKDHLILHYDTYTRPIQDETSIIWPDISGNNNYATMQGTNMDDCYQNGAVVTNTNNPYFSKDLSSLLTSTSDYTIELTYIAYGTANGTITLANRTYGHWYYDVYSDGLVRTMTRTADNTANNWPTATNTGLQEQYTLNTFTLTNKYNGTMFYFQYYGNGQALTTDGCNGIYQSNTELVIGQDYDYSYISQAYIYSVRIYDKQLTGEEIQNNYNIDKLRFE